MRYQPRASTMRSRKEECHECRRESSYGPLRSALVAKGRRIIDSSRFCGLRRAWSAGALSAALGFREVGRDSAPRVSLSFEGGQPKRAGFSTEPSVAILGWSPQG